MYYRYHREHTDTTIPMHCATCYARSLRHMLCTITNVMRRCSAAPMRNTMHIKSRTRAMQHDVPQSSPSFYLSLALALDLALILALSSLSLSLFLSTFIMYYFIL